MSPLFILAGVFFALGLIPLTNGLLNAPEAFEDETGFNLTWKNNRPDIQDVSCVWTSLSTVSGMDHYEDGSSRFHAA